MRFIEMSGLLAGATERHVGGRTHRAGSIC
jgi:hypothetical protein